VAKVEIEDDKEVIDFIEREMKDLDDTNFKTGIFASEDGSKQVMKAYVHEFGVDIEVTDRMRGWFMYQGMFIAPSTTKITIPERSYLRKTFDEKENDIVDLMMGQIEGILRHKNTSARSKKNIKVGLRGMVRKTMEDVKKPPLSDLTLQRRTKGSDANPLIDTGTLWKAITTIVDD